LPNASGLADKAAATYERGVSTLLKRRVLLRFSQLLEKIIIAGTLA
jgi:hypothetical protein